MTLVSREVDEPVLRAVQSLQRSVPREHKDQLKAALRPLGWSGFKMEVRLSTRHGWVPYRNRPVAPDWVPY